VSLSILKTGKARAIRFSTLEAVRSALTCQPGDILELLPATAEGKKATASEAESDRLSKKA
jgi:putative transcriptional regulator